MCSIPWLPPLVCSSAYDDFDEYLDALYDYFAIDFIKSNPLLLNKPVKSKRVEPYKQKDHSFWHCIEKAIPGKEICEENREIVFPLCERIRWPRPVIEKAIASEDVLAWTEIRRGSGTVERVHLFVPKESYVVVLDPRKLDSKGAPEYYYLWTTFMCQGRQAQSLMKRYEKNKKLI